MDQPKNRSEIHLARRGWHVLAGAAVLSPVLFLDMPIIYLACFALVFSLVGFFYDFKRLRNEELNEKLQSFFMPIIRSTELDGFSGIPFYALGVSLSCFFYSKEVAILSILFLIFADPIASIVGVYLGKARIFPNKTLEGTIACFVVCFFVTIFYCQGIGVKSDYLLLFALVSGIAGSLAELLSAFNIDDNFTIPVVSGGAMMLFASFFPVF